MNMVLHHLNKVLGDPHEHGVTPPK
jgi:hypothetical protein